MDSITGILTGFEVVFQPTNLIYCLVGVVIGMLIGVLPGLGTVATISILLPLTFDLPPATAIIMIAGIFYGAQYGGTITSVLLQLPGEASSVVTTIDGYQMARRGRAGSALGIAAIGSFIGGTVSIVGLSLLAPVVANFALDFGPPEYAVLALTGILLVSSFGTGSAWKCIVAAILGLLLATVGRDLFTGVERFTLDSTQLADGIDFAALVMGLFGLGEVFYDLERRSRVLASRAPSVHSAWITKTDWVQSRMAIARGTIIGFVLGVLPGGGATLSSLVAYAAEKKAAKDPSEFGHGAIQGVAGPETANNAAATSSFIPLLTLGIPANATMAVIYGALLLQGITPGPTLINDHPDVFWGVINSMWIGNILLLILSVPLVRVFIKILQVRGSIMMPITLMIIILGAYSVRNSIFDIWIVLAFGVIGFLMKKFGFEPGPLVLAFVLGNLLETSFRQSLRMFNGDLTGFLTRPISGTLAALIFVVPVALVMAKRVRARRATALTLADKEYEVT